MASTAVVSLTIHAAPGHLYDLISDVARMGEWSPEATGARGAAKSPAVGESFVGWNRRGPVRWFTNCTVRRADHGRVFEFDVDFGPIPVSRWTYELEPSGDGGTEVTEVTETWVDRREGLISLPVRVFGKFVIPGDRAEHNHTNMRVTLERLKAAAEG